MLIILKIYNCNGKKWTENSKQNIFKWNLYFT